VENFATCAKCGQQKELCNSVRINKIKQPRICRDCLLEQMQTGDETTNDVWWAIQLHELKDQETIDALLTNRQT